MRDLDRRGFVAGDDDARADLGGLPQKLREFGRQADAAVRGRIAGQGTFVQGCSGPGDPLHVGHLGVVEIGNVMAVLLQNAEDADRGRMGCGARGNLGLRDGLAVGVERRALLVDRDDDVQRTLGDRRRLVGFVQRGLAGLASRL